MDYPKLGKRIEPPEGVEAKLGDTIAYEVIYPDGQIGTISTTLTQFDLDLAEQIKNQPKPTIKFVDLSRLDDMKKEEQQ